MMNVVASHDPMRKVDARLKYEKNSRSQRWMEERRGKHGGGAGIQDVAVGDENEDITMDDVEEYARQQRSLDSLRSRFNVWNVITGATIGALIGSVLGSLQINKVFDGDSTTQPNYESAGLTMWGLLSGSCFGALLVAMGQCFLIVCRRGNRWRDEQKRKKEMLRRKEMEMIERHDEFVYYDAMTQQSYLRRCLCCPHYGKITSERIIYSEAVHVGPMPSCCWLCKPREVFRWVQRLLCKQWNKEVEQIDYDVVLDVSVDQTWTQYCLNTGSVTLHCAGSADTSTVKAERERLVNALQEEDERMLREAILTAGNMKVLRPLVNRCKNVVTKLTADRKQREGDNFKPMYVKYPKHQNTSKNITVLDVVAPYTVMDDISYRISKYLKLNTKDRIVIDSDASATMLGDEFMAVPEAIAANAAGRG